MNTTKCQILLKAVELGSITRAAEALGYTQSAVSRAVADLEREWDMALLTRNRSGVVLTLPGGSPASLFAGPLQRRAGIGDPSGRPSWADPGHSAGGHLRQRLHSAGCPPS
ncbi:MAG: LysR family transcriptional regulator [Oscillospiraceae bacterium]